MISAKVLLCVLLIVHLNWVEGICERYGSHCIAKRNGSTVYFGLMLSYPESPLGRRALASDFDDGHDIAPAAYLAVEQINNRSDLLTDYHVELLRLDGGCDVTERTVVGINNLACSCKPIVGIVGPSCDKSALMVGEFTGRDQFSMVTINYGERNILGDREVFPFAFSIMGSNFITILAFTELVIENNWSRIVLLYSEDSLDLSEVSVGIEKTIKKIPGFDVAFNSPIYDNYIPLQEIKQSFARLIIVLLSAEATLRTLCLAFHEGMIFPKYQWVFKERFENDFTEISFCYGEKHHFCTEKDINTILYGGINFVWSLDFDITNRTIDDSLTSESVEYEEGYEEQRKSYMNEYNVISMPVEWARGIYDAVWSLAFALNGSLEKLNMDLTQVVPGSKTIAQAIANHMPDVNFQGVSGRIDFDKETGFNTARRINIYQFGAAKSSTLIGFYTSEELVIFSNTTPQFIIFNVQVSTQDSVVAVPFFIITVALFFFIVPIHIINIIYRNHPAIKATSPKLNHLIFIGCYLTMIGCMLYIIAEGWQYAPYLCITLPWFLSIGTTLVLGTVCVKTWRLYYIYSLSKKAARLQSKIASDSVLGGFVGVFTSVDVVICLLWSWMDPLHTTEVIRVIENGAVLTIAEAKICECSQLLPWIFAIKIYKCVLITCSFILALLTRMKRKEFKTNNVVILSYILTVLAGVGMIPVFYLYAADVSVSSVRFISLCLYVDMIIYICFFALFLPSIILFFMEKVFHHHYDKEHTLS